MLEANSLAPRPLAAFRPAVPLCYGIRLQVSCQRTASHTWAKHRPWPQNSSILHADWLFEGRPLERGRGVVPPPSSHKLQLWLNAPQKTEEIGQRLCGGYHFVLVTVWFMSSFVSVFHATIIEMILPILLYIAGLGCGCSEVLNIPCVLFNNLTLNFHSNRNCFVSKMENYTEWTSTFGTHVTFNRELCFNPLSPSICLKSFGHY